MPIPSQTSERSYICVLGYLLCFPRFWYLHLEFFWMCGNFSFSFYCKKTIYKMYVKIFGRRYLHWWTLCSIHYTYQFRFLSLSINAIRLKYMFSSLQLLLILDHFWIQGSSWSYGSWIYNYMCHRFLSPLNLWVRTPFMARCTRYNIMSVTWDRSVVSSTNNTDRHDITEILWKVVLV